MNVNELAKEVHANAVSHGWWDDKRSVAEIVALIHSEWSEALEEARAGRPLIYKNGIGKPLCITPDMDDYKKHMGKPEGIAVELIDGCIRILDAFAYFNVHFNDQRTLDDLMDDAKENVPSKSDDISTIIAFLHYETSMLFISGTHGAVKGEPSATFLLGALGIALAWVREQGLDPLAVLLEKHEYNKTRPYKHGKKF